MNLFTSVSYRWDQSVISSWLHSRAEKWIHRDFSFPCWVIQIFKILTFQCQLLSFSCAHECACERAFWLAHISCKDSRSNWAQQPLEMLTSKAVNKCLLYFNQCTLISLMENNHTFYVHGCWSSVLPAPDVNWCHFLAGRAMLNHFLLHSTHFLSSFTFFSKCHLSCRKWNIHCCMRPWKI